MAGCADRPDYESLTGHLRQCLEKSKSCPTLYRLSVNAIAISQWKLIERELAQDVDDYSFFLRSKHRLIINRIKLPEVIKRYIPRHLVPDLEYEISAKITQIFEYEDDVHSWLGIRGKPEFIWTPRGRLDVPATIHSLILKEDDCDDNDCRNKLRSLYLAVYFCLEENVIRLWPKYNESLKDSSLNILELEYWESFVAQKAISPNKIKNLVKRGIGLEMAVGRDYMVKYFWKKLDHNRRVEFLREWIQYLKPGDLCAGTLCNVGYFFLTVASESQLLSLMQSKPFAVLRILTVSSIPEMKLYSSSVIERISRLLNDNQRNSVVSLLLDQARESTLMFYEQHFMILWTGGSNEWRSSMPYTINILLEVLLNKRRDLLTAIFKHATVEEKLELLSDIMRCIVHRFVELQPTFDKLVEEFLETENSVRTFKTQLASYAIQYHLRDLMKKEIYLEFFSYCDTL